MERKIPPDMTEVKTGEQELTGVEKKPRLFLTVRDAAEALELSEGRIYQMVTEGKIPATRRGRRIRIPRAAFERWLELEAEIALANLTDDGAA